ncbi:hypothetical protein HK102_012225, partial [Quaeritorhiza haematococci]
MFLTTLLSIHTLLLLFLQTITYLPNYSPPVSHVSAMLTPRSFPHPLLHRGADRDSTNPASETNAWLVRLRDDIGSGNGIGDAGEELIPAAVEDRERIILQEILAQYSNTNKKKVSESEAAPQPDGGALAQIKRVFSFGRSGSGDGSADAKEAEGVKDVKDADGMQGFRIYHVE